MKKRQSTLLFLSLLFFMVNSVAFAQNSTTQGTDFWLSFGHNGYYQSTPINYQIRVVAAAAATVTFTFTLTGSSETIRMAAGTVYTKDLTEQEVDNVYSNATGISSKSVRIQSTALISVYALNQRHRSTDATNVLPVKAIGTDYYHISYTTAIDDGYTIVATEPNTEIYEGGVLKASLYNAGQVYSSYFSSDGTGRHITSNKPIAYFVTNPITIEYAGVVAGDCMFQQLPPTNTWGKNFLVPVTKRGIERTRIVASRDGTVIQQVGGTVVEGSLNLNQGDFVEMEVKLANKGCYISSNEPVGVCSYLVDMEYPGLLYENGDPSQAWIAPIEQMLDKIVIAPFTPSGNTLINEHYALLITPTKAKGKTTQSVGTGSAAPLSGVTWVDNPACNYSFCSAPLTNNHTSYIFANPEGLIIIGYGLGFHESYFYLAGSAIRDLEAAFYVNDTYYDDMQGRTICGLDSLYRFRADVRNALSSTAGYLKWYINGEEETAARDSLEWEKVLRPGSYTIEMAAMGVSGESDTIRTAFTITNPATPVLAITPGPASTICAGTPATFIATADNGSYTLSYTWKKNGRPAGTNSATYADNSLAHGDIISCEIASGIDCIWPVSDSIEMTVYPLPSLAIAANGPPFYLGLDYKLRIRHPENGVVYDWYKDNAATEISGPDYILEKIKKSDDGSYFVEAVNSYDCYAKSDPLAVATEQAPLIIPNVFTPNGDGINDYFLIAGLENYAKSELVIVSKRGATVYSKTGYDNSWNADGQPDDIYYYRLKVFDEDGNATSHKGYVQVKRK